jgi:CPA2 family monovalent cation:H+ antiporter-2
VGLEAILILLAAAVVLATVFRYLQLPHLLAYLAAGVLIGPHGLHWIPDTENTRYLAEFGVVFLLFTLGLEFSLPRLLAMKRLVLGLGGAQVVLSTAVFAAIAWWLGVPVQGAVVIGGMLAMSSTAIVVKLLVEQLEQHSRHGRAAIGVLLFQDLAVVPFLILIPAFGGQADGTSVALALGWSLLKAAAVLAGILFLGRWGLRPLFHEIARARAREFFVLAVLLVTLASAWLTQASGLSLALGAFLAGMMLGETEYRHQVEADIQPFRDVLLGLFFVTVGMMLDLATVWALAPWVVAAVFAIVLFKTLLVFALGRLFGLEAGVALRTGLVLAQVGEFAFVLLMQAEQHALLPSPAAQIVLAAALISMMLTPLVLRYNGALARWFVPSYVRARHHNLDLIRAEADHLPGGHVLICGYGRSGQNLAWMLEQEGMASLAFDLDPVRVRDARDAGKPVVYGDATRRDVLEAAGLARARALAITFNDVSAALKILDITRHLRPDMPVVVRTVDDADLERLYAAGATEVVPESLEGSLMIGSHLLLLLGVPVSRIVKSVREVRRDRYRMLRGFFHGEDLFEAKQTEAYRARLHAVVLPEGARAVGQRLADLHLETLGVDVSAVRRGGIRGPQPAPETRLQVGDVLVLYGTPEALEQAEKILLEG